VTPIRVLIADPDESLLAAYRDLPQKEFEVVTASNGLNCVAHLREHSPDVLVLEPHLPCGGGAGVLAAMHADPALADVPVMIVTACRNRRVLESIAAYRIRDYRVKPLAPVQLAARIRIVLVHRTGRCIADDPGKLLNRWNEWRPDAVTVTP
jgi:response regulator RpfG family c-di-GMP phosphodiesterase